MHILYSEHRILNVSCIECKPYLNVSAVVLRFTCTLSYITLTCSFFRVKRLGLGECATGHFIDRHAQLSQYDNIVCCSQTGNQNEMLKLQHSKTSKLKCQQAMRAH